MGTQTTTAPTHPPTHPTAWQHVRPRTGLIRLPGSVSVLNTAAAEVVQLYSCWASGCHHLNTYLGGRCEAEGVGRSAVEPLDTQHAPVRHTQAGHGLKPRAGSSPQLATAQPPHSPAALVGQVDPQLCGATERQRSKVLRS